MSSWTIAEFASALGLRVRRGHLSLKDAVILMQTLKADIKTSMYVLEPTAEDFALATDLLLSDLMLGLRTPDALHLALAINRATTLVTLDRKLKTAGVKLGYDATDKGILKSLN